MLLCVCVFVAVLHGNKTLPVLGGSGLTDTSAPDLSCKLVLSLSCRCVCVCVCVCV
jgi:hypothetical protein